MSLLIRTDVSAVKLHTNLILAGIGSTLHVFRQTSTKLLQKTHCLNGQKIYGIVPSECSSKILIFGGKQFCVISMTGEESSILEQIFEAIVCEDWLHSGVWISNDTIALLTAHNVVEIWDTSKQCLVSQYVSEENSILYSGLLLPLQKDVLVFAGTVFSEIIIHACSGKKSLHYLKGHKGVIFSISCDLQKGIIVTTSDDRSVRIWGINNLEILENIPHNTIDFWQTADIVCRREVYGHMARVMRNCISKDMVISVGEDSIICFWDLNGNLLKKTMAHQNGGIWSVDADRDYLVTGGGDAAVTLHPLTTVQEIEAVGINTDAGIPKKVVFTARGNLVILNDQDDIIYYDVKDRTETRDNLTHESTYKLLSISSCKQMIAVVDMAGRFDVFVESCRGRTSLNRIINTKLNIGKILSMQWAGNRHIVLCSEGGLITVLASNQTDTEVFVEYILPQCKERWLTAAAISNNTLVVGDRCGNIHLYVKGNKNPVKTFIKVHGRYGPTSITIKINDIVTTGRDGTIKYFELDNKEKDVAKYMSNKNLEFQWVEKFVDRDENIVCGFQERIFVVYDLKKGFKLVEVLCGGGHRAWDVIRYFEKTADEYKEYINFIYVKGSDIFSHTFDLSKIVSTNIVNGSHFKEINCLKSYKSYLDETVTFCISGGEDTTLRISSIDNDMRFQDKVIFKHLSSIRTLKTKQIDNDRVLLVSAGGRAQVCMKLLQFSKTDKIKVKTTDLIDYLIKGSEKERKGRKTWRDCSIDFDPETRIMDIDLSQGNENILMFAGCSDAYLRIYNFNLNNKTFHPITEVKHHKTCILKTKYIKFHDKDMLITCTTRGEVTFWYVNTKELKIEPVLTTVTNKSGINSLDTIMYEDKLLFATGGDDNSIHMNVLEITYGVAKITNRWSSEKIHCSQITGVILLENILISTSIDQRVTAYKWSIYDGIYCEFISQMYSDVADIQGMDLIDCTSDHVTVCVYGKGIEIIKIPTQN